MDINQWYKPIVLPKSWVSSRIEPFIYSMSSIWQQSFEFATRPQVVFVDPKVISTAAADMQQNRILINRDLWSPSDKKRPNPSKEVDHVLTTIIGLQIHETLHFLLTKDSKDVLMKRNDLPEDDIALLTIFNIVEDTFIDNQRDVYFPSLSWSYKCLFEYFFEEKDVLELVQGLPKECKTYDDAVKFISVMPAFRVFNYMFEGHSDEFVRDLYKMVMESESINSVDSRVKHSKKVYDFLFKDIKDDEGKEKNNSKGKGGAKDNFEKQLRENVANDIVENIEIPEGSIFVDDDMVCYGSEIGKNNKFLYKPNKGVQRRFFDVDENTECEIDISKLSKRYAPLGHLIRTQSDVRRYMGEQRDSGVRMRQLYRIATDQKIFSDPIISKGIGPREIGILIDLSGSMHDQFINAFEAAGAAAISLTNGGHKCFVVGHTSDYESKSTGQGLQLIFPIFKELHETIDVMIERMKEFAQYPTMSGNNDDLAVLECENFFSKVANNKKLIVISDGQPASRRISSATDGIKKTRSAVKKLRDARIDVVSLSIKSSAVEGNNLIYDKQKNVSNEDVNAVIDLVKALTVG